MDKADNKLDMKHITKNIERLYYSTLPVKMQQTLITYSKIVEGHKRATQQMIRFDLSMNKYIESSRLFLRLDLERAQYSTLTLLNRIKPAQDYMSWSIQNKAQRQKIIDYAILSLY